MVTGVAGAVGQRRGDVGVPGQHPDAEARGVVERLFASHASVERVRVMVHRDVIGVVDEFHPVHAMTLVT
jgi:hypothetical protein